MNLAKLFEMQRVLDERIEQEHPRTEGEDRLAKKILALQVELGELANEWRGFKFWSKDQEPRTYKTCYRCGGDGVDIVKAQYVQKCAVCNETGKVEGNPLLEEYVDCLHFILSIGFEKLEIHGEKVEVRSLIRNQVQKSIRNSDSVINQFNALFIEVSALYNSTNPDSYSFQFGDHVYQNILSLFVGLGEMLGFTWEQIEEAYFAKNAVNHERQENGY